MDYTASCKDLKEITSLWDQINYPYRGAYYYESIRKNLIPINLFYPKSY